VKFLDEYRDSQSASVLVEAIKQEASRPWVVMEVCGGQTHAIVRYGLDELLGGAVELVHGPGCPVCVTPLQTIDRAHAIARQPGVIFCSFGDMLRVPGSNGDLFDQSAHGADVRVVYSPLDAVRIAQQHSDKQVVLFAIGFETTAPAHATAALMAKDLGLRNFSVLCAMVLVPPAIAAIVNSSDNRVQGFLGPGHVCAVMGIGQYEPLAQRYRVPIVVTGFEPLDLLEGILRLVRRLECGKAGVEVQYSRAVTPDGNAASRAAVERVFEPADRAFRGLGVITEGGYRLTREFEAYDAERRFAVEQISSLESSECIAGDVLRGLKRPIDCAAFGERCTPEHPLGAPMVSNEGACAAYNQHGRERLVPLRLGGRP